MLPKAVLLDRDGVINFDSPDYILSPEQWQPIPGSLEAIARLKAHGIAVTVISNQSGLGRGMMDEATFQAIHATMLAQVQAAGGRFDHTAYCPHAPDDACTCRKPLPGMVTSTLEALGLSDSPHEVVMIGDSLRDVQAALAGGVRPILVQSGYGDAAAILQRAQTLDASIQAFPDLKHAADALLRESS